MAAINNTPWRSTFAYKLHLFGNSHVTKALLIATAIVLAYLAILSHDRLSALLGYSLGATTALILATVILPRLGRCLAEHTLTRIGFRQTLLRRINEGMRGNTPQEERYLNALRVIVLSEPVEELPARISDGLLQAAGQFGDGAVKLACLKVLYPSVNLFEEPRAYGEQRANKERVALTYCRARRHDEMLGIKSYQQ